MPYLLVLQCCMKLRSPKGLRMMGDEVQGRIQLKTEDTLLIIIIAWETAATHCIEEVWISNRIVADFHRAEISGNATNPFWQHRIIGFSLLLKWISRRPLALNDSFGRNQHCHDNICPHSTGGNKTVQPVALGEDQKRDANKYSICSKCRSRRNLTVWKNHTKPAY